jgi:hypothetical protein
MSALRIHTIVKKDGEISMIGLPFKKGQSVDLILLPESSESTTLTARQLLQSGLIGLWKDREDIHDSAAYARQLREQTQNR